MAVHICIFILKSRMLVNWFNSIASKSVFGSKNESPIKISSKILKSETFWKLYVVIRNSMSVFEIEGAACAFWTFPYEILDNVEYVLREIPLIIKVLNMITFCHYTHGGMIKKEIQFFLRFLFIWVNFLFYILIIS